MKKINFLFLMICFVLNIYPQNVQNKSEKYVPQWMNKLPVPSNPSFIYVIVTAEATTLEIARENCLKKLADNQQLKQSVSVSMDRENKQNIHQNTVNGKLNETVNNYTTVTVNIKGKEIELTANRIDEYWETAIIGWQNMYVCHTLFAVATTNLPVLFDNVTFTRKYGISGFARSLIPGWGQLYKGQKVKGACFMGGEILLVGSVIVSENLRSSYIKKMKEQPKFFKTYNTKADNWENIRNVCIGAAAALYVYNLIDAIVSPGAKRTIVNKQEFPLVYPVTNKDFSGVSFSWNF